MDALRGVGAAACGAAITDTIFNPLEVVKTRLQVDTDRRLYIGMRQTAAQIVSEEGILGIWKPGLPATWIRAVTYTGMRVGLYPTMKPLLQSWSGDGIFTKIISGACTGAVASMIASPVDLIRIRLQGESGKIAAGHYVTGLRTGHAPTHSGTMAAFRDVARSEGFLGLWKGATANMIRASMMSAGQLASYDQSKYTILRLGWASDGPALHFLCSSFSGFVAQVACMPADVVRTRMYCKHSSSHYRNPLHCALEISKAEGWRGLYRGFVPAASRQIPVMSIQMPLVEFFRRHVFGLPYL